MKLENLKWHRYRHNPLYMYAKCGKHSVYYDTVRGDYCIALYVDSAPKIHFTYLDPLSAQCILLEYGPKDTSQA